MRDPYRWWSIDEMESEVDYYRYKMLDHEDAHEERYFEMRDRFRMETEHLRAQNEHLIRAIGEMRVFTPILPVIHTSLSVPNAR